MTLPPDNNESGGGNPPVRLPATTTGTTTGGTIARPKQRHPFYLNWVLWLVLSVSLVAVSVGLVIAFGPVAIIVPIGVIATVVSATAGPVIGAWEKVNEKLKDMRERTDRSADRVEINSERADLLEKQYEILSNMAYQLTENLQQERVEARIVTTELKAQNQQQQKEINELKEQIRLMGLEKSGDKEKIIRLESQVKQLQEQVRGLQERESKLVAENEQLIQANYDLRSGLRRRVTDNLPGLSTDADTADRLSHLEEKERERERENHER